MSDNLKIPFKPVRGKDENIQAMTTQNGYLYLATDTRKMYLGMEDEGEKRLMGYDTGIFYGKKEIPEDNSGNIPDPEVLFHIDEIEGDRLPLENDLVLNVDGCFYRVESVLDDQNIKTQRLTLQGTGTGGGGTGTGGGSSFNISFSNASKSYVYSTEATEMDIGFISYYNGEDDNFLQQITFTLANAEEPFLTTSVNKDGEALVFNKTHFIDLSPYKSLFNTTNTSVKVAIYDKYGVERSDTIKIRMVAISLTATEDVLFAATTTERTYSCNLAGATSGVKDKKITYKFYKEEDLNNIIVTQERSLNLGDEGSIQKVLDFSSGFEHGIYVMKVQAQATIAGTNNIIYSNILTHKVAYYTPNGQPLLMVLAPDKTEQYTNIPINYLFVTDEAGKSYTLDIKLNNQAYQALNITSNSLGVYNFYFEDTGSYVALFTILEAAITATLNMYITAYTGNLPVIDPTRDDLMLYLNPKGKTNDATNRTEWADYNGRYTANLTGLHYSDADGWLMDDQGTSYLKLVSGAKMKLSDFKPFEYDPTKTSAQNTRAGYGMTIELDFELNGILNFEKPSIRCVSTNKNGVVQCGFQIIGNTIQLYNSRLNGQDGNGTLANQTLVEGKRMRVSFVIEPQTGNIKFPMCYTYLNGKISGAVIYKTGEGGDRFEDSIDNPALLEIDSTYAQVKIYGIRFYSSALADKVILNNYTTTFAQLEDRQNNYDTNNVFDANGNVDFKLVASEDYNLQIPYMKLTGGYKTMSDSKWQLVDKTNESVGLPTGKKDYRLVDVEVVYPKNEYFKDFTNYTFINQFANGKGMSDNAGEKPSNGGAIMYAQGTSSMEYPVKNLRLRFKNKGNWYTVRPDLSIAPSEIICMKADYMESSGSHNTGTANFVDSLYKEIGIATPGQKHYDKRFNEDSTETIITCIKGHPCLIFYSETGEAGTYKYIGKYNLNLDKATPEQFGFKSDDSFGYLSAGDTYLDEDGNRITVGENDKVNSIHCFEFLDNSIPVCNFLNAQDAENYYDTWYGSTADGDPGWTVGFESRYPEDKVGFHDADSLWPLASWVNELYTLRQTDEAQALARFKNEYECYFDKDFLLSYYLITEALLMVDSRVKNMMIATWGPEARSYKPLKQDESGNWIIDTNADEVATYNYIFYPIFYDMDTALGLDNTGVPKFNYYDEDTDPMVYNGEEVLWNLVRDALSIELRAYFNKMENASSFASEALLKYYNDNQANMANEAFYNGDAHYKYIGPAREGYQDLLNNKYIEPGAGPYLYAAQGDRSLSRESIINDRMRFLRGKYTSTKFSTGDRIEYRINYPKIDSSTGSSGYDPIRLAASIKAVPPNSYFDFNSLKTGYAGVQIGANSPIVMERFDGAEKKSIYADTTNANGTEAYILGLSILSDVGDLSDKYMQKFIMSSSDIRLKTLTLGNPHKDYYNPFWNMTQGGQAPSITLTNCTYLENFNLQNCDAYNNTIDFSACTAIKKILLTGSGTSAITLPTNGLLTELRLPMSIKDLRIEGHAGLTASNFSLGTYEYGEDGKIGGANGRYVNNYSQLQTLYIIDTPIDTYEIVQQASDLTKYYLQGIDWEITEVEEDKYCLRTADELAKKHGEAIPANTYYYYDNGYILYGETSYPSSGSLYERVSMLDADGNIVCIPTLEWLQTRGLAGDKITKHSEALSGIITLNIPDHKVIELDLYNKYASVYPNVNIKYGENMEGNVTSANRINFYRIDSNSMGNMDIANAEPYFTTLTASNSGKSLADLITNSSFINPVKNSTVKYTYTFTGRWIDWNDTNKTVYYQDINIQDGFEKQFGDTLFSETYPDSDMNLVPIFTEAIRKYQVTLYDDDGKTVLTTAAIDYESDIGEFFENNVNENASYTHAYYNYKEYTNEANPDYRYAFKGWHSATDFKQHATSATYSTLVGRKVTADVVFYAFYMEEDANSAISEITSVSDFFDYKENYTVGEETGAQIKLKDKYRYLLRGKITLPKVSPSGTPIISIGDFSAKHSEKGTYNSTYFTHVYFKDRYNTSYIEVGQNAFAAGSGTNDRVDTGLTAVYLPPSITILEDHAFYLVSSLKTVTLTDNITKMGNSVFWDTRNIIDIGLDELPANLQSVGAASFYKAGDGIKATKLPVGLTKISSWILGGCKNVNLTSLGSEGAPIINMEKDALNGAGNGTVHELTIYCQDIDAIKAGAFDDYKTANLTSLTICGPEGIDFTSVYGTWGLKITASTTIVQPNKGGSV